MPNTPDGIYDTTKPWTRPRPWSYSSPNETNEERRVSEAINSVTQAGTDLQDIVRPPLGQVDLFRPRFGYRQRALRIDDIIEIGVPDGPVPNTDAQAATRNSFGSGTW